MKDIKQELLSIYYEESIKDIYRSPEEKEELRNIKITIETLEKYELLTSKKLTRDSK